MMQTIEDCARAAEKRTSRRGYGRRPTSGSQHQPKQHLDLRQSELQDKREKKRVLWSKGNADVKLQNRPPGKMD